MVVAVTALLFAEVTLFNVFLALATTEYAVPPERLLMVNVFDVPDEPKEFQDEPPFVEYCQLSQVVFAVAVKLTLLAVALLNLSVTVGAVLSSLSNATVLDVDIVP